MGRAGAGLLALALLVLPAATSGPPRAQDGSRTFQGTWSAAGRRDTLATEGGRTAAIIHLSGAVVLTVGDGLGRGFRGEVLAFADGQGVRLGRSLWTDERGDRIFGELRGDPLETGMRVTGRITGGTGRYEGITGEFELTWQYVVQDEDGRLQGFARDLRGRWRPGPGRP